MHKLIRFDPDAFIAADPLAYLLAAVIVFIFGPGSYSVDAILKRAFSSEPKSKIIKSPISLAPNQ